MSGIEEFYDTDELFQKLVVYWEIQFTKLVDMRKKRKDQANNRAVLALECRDQRIREDICSYAEKHGFSSEDVEIFLDSIAVKISNLRS